MQSSSEFGIQIIIRIMKVTNDNSWMGSQNEALSAANGVSHLFGEYVSRELEKIGMRYSYRHVLKPLMENRSLTQLELVNMTKLKAPTISITLRNMEREGIVSRQKNDQDRRETHVAITDKGKKLYKKVLDVLANAEKITLEGLTDKELKALHTTLNKMSKNLNDVLDN